MALNLLKMHQQSVYGTGGRRAGAWRRPRTPADVRASILRKIGAIKAAERAEAELDAGLLAAEAEFAGRMGAATGRRRTGRAGLRMQEVQGVLLPGPPGGRWNPLLLPGGVRPRILE